MSEVEVFFGGSRAGGVIQLFGDEPGDMLSDFGVAIGSVVDVTRFDELFEREGFGNGVEVVDGDIVLGHDFGCDLVVFDVVADVAAGFTFGHHGGMSPDQSGVGGLEFFDELGEVFSVVVGRGELGAMDFIAMALFF